MARQGLGQKKLHYEEERINEDDITVYVDAPTFTPNSNGIKCIYYLAKRLASNGVKIKFLPRNIRGFRANLPAEFRCIKASPQWGIQGPAILVCSESVPAKTIRLARKRGVRILWWYLAPHGLLEKQLAPPRSGEKIITFSPFVFPEEGYCYFQPPLDLPWSRALETFRPKSDHKTIEIGLYCGKGRLKALPENLRALLFNSNVHIITRSYPASRNELFSLMTTIDGLITFDELSQLTLEAATLGVPVLLANPLFPRNCLNMFPVDITSFITREPEEFMERLIRRRQGQLKAISKSSIFALNSKSIEVLIHAIHSDSWGWTAGDNARRHNIFTFGQHLRDKHILYPHYGGQSAGTYFLGLYIASLQESALFHHFVCRIISFVDELGRLFFLAGGGRVFESFASRVKRSKSLREGTRFLGKLGM